MCSSNKKVVNPVAVSGSQFGEPTRVIGNCAVEDGIVLALVQRMRSIEPNPERNSWRAINQHRSAGCATRTAIWPNSSQLSLSLQNFKKNSTYQKEESDYKTNHQCRQSVIMGFGFGHS